MIPAHAPFMNTALRAPAAAMGSTLLGLGLLLLLSNATPTYATARALAIGLNTVSPAAYGEALPDLRVCEADARAMLDIAQKQEFDECTSLLGPKATVAAVRAALKRAATITGPKDLFVISYSGHGSLAEDESGDEQYDQTWCLYDGQIIDDELAQAWAAFPEGARIVVISDSCHSGSIIKVNTPQSASSQPWLEKGVPAELQKRLTAQWGAPWRLLPPSTTTLQKVKAAVLSLSACQDYAKAYVLTGHDHSLFTRHLLAVWDKGAFMGSHAVFHNRIHPLVKTEAQTSQLNQETNKLPLGKNTAVLEAQRPWTK